MVGYIHKGYRSNPPGRSSIDWRSVIKPGKLTISPSITLFGQDLQPNPPV
jgi:hypothetical protein